MNIQVKKTDSLIIPSREADHDSSGYDVIAISDPQIKGLPAEPFLGDQGETIQTWRRVDYIQYATGLFISPQADSYGRDYHTLIFPRSSVSKYNLVLANCIGLIDVDYRGEVIFRFKYIWQPEDYFIYKGAQLVGQVRPDRIYKKGDAIGQLVAEVKNDIDWMVVAELTSTVRGAGGFGSRELRATSPVGPTTDSRLTKMYQEIIGGDTHKTTYETAMKEQEKKLS